MRNRIFLSTALATVTLVQPASAADAAPVEQAVTAFRSLCGAGLFNSESILARAKQRGWRWSGADAPETFDPANQRLAPLRSAPLILKVTSEASKGERRDACSISIEMPTTGLAGAVQRWLSFPPSFAMGRSATYFAVHTGETWQPGALGKLEFDQAKAQGRFYSIMVLDRGAEEPGHGPPASIVLLRVMPDLKR
jgi:hypothetical protein